MNAPRGFQPWMRLGVPELDHDHQKILTACDLFTDAIAVGDLRAGALLLDALMGTAAAHFVDEERILHAAGCPTIAAHIRHHDEARRRLRRLAEAFEAGTGDVGGIASEIKHFFLDTLIPEDLHYRPYVQAGVAPPGPSDAVVRLAGDLTAMHGGAAQGIAEGIRDSLRGSGHSEHALMWDDVVRHLGRSRT